MGDPEKSAAAYTMVLRYVGGHPELPTAGVCSVQRSEDGGTVRLTIGNDTVTEETTEILRIDLVTASQVETKRKSSSGTLMGGLMTGPGNMLHGGSTQRNRAPKTLHDDKLLWTLASGAEVVFSDTRHRSPDRWYPKAVTILSRGHA